MVVLVLIFFSFIQIAYVHAVKGDGGGLLKGFFTCLTYSGSYRLTQNRISQLCGSYVWLWIIIDLLCT
jgi:hypothetical protein